MLLPLIGGMAVHAGRPLFPADIALALGELPAPRVLVSTPVHLRTIVESSQQFPASRADRFAQPRRWIASWRRPSKRSSAASCWRCSARPRPACSPCRRTATGGRVALHTTASSCIREPTARWSRRRGSSSRCCCRTSSSCAATGSSSCAAAARDMIEVAGKRASLADLTRRLLAIEGVRDAVLFQPRAGCGRDDPPRRCARGRAGCSARQIRDRLAAERRSGVPAAPAAASSTALPRNELGKLPREQLLAMLQRRSAESAKARPTALCTRSPGAARGGRCRPPGRSALASGYASRSRSAIIGTSVGSRT